MQICVKKCVSWHTGALQLLTLVGFSHEPWFPNVNQMLWITLLNQLYIQTETDSIRDSQTLSSKKYLSASFQSVYPPILPPDHRKWFPQHEQDTGFSSYRKQEVTSHPQRSGFHFHLNSSSWTGRKPALKFYR